MITLKNVSKFYYNKGIIASGFSKINVEFNLGEFIAITGESGSGKSTLLHVISGLDSYEEGEMYINGEETSHYTKEDFESYRKKYISNIFQNFNLVNSYTVYQNIELVLLLAGKKKAEAKPIVNSLMKKVGIYRYRNTKVSKLSGGQKQRTAIARALAKDTPIIIADEPTGNLDSKSAKEIIKLLHDVSQNKLVIIVTHNYEQVESYATRKIKMHDGKILEDKILHPTSKTECSIKEKTTMITFFEKLRLGIRNTFNIIPKFILVFLVYLFITVAVITEYAFFKQQEYTASSSGYNNYFSDTTDTRIIIKRKDGNILSDADYEKIHDIPHVKYIIQNDLLLDTTINLLDGANFYFSATTNDIDNFDGKLDLGRMPKNDQEIILAGRKNDYYLSTMGQDLIGKTIYIEDRYGNSYQDTKLTIVGIFYEEQSIYYSSGKLYASKAIIDKLNFSINKEYSQLQVLFQNEYHQSYPYDIPYKVIPNSQVADGKAIISKDWNFNCPKENCINQPLTIEVSNLYYQDTLNLTIQNTYHAKNINTLLNIKNFDEYNGAIFISTNDYNKLFNRGNYQSSLFVDHVTNLNTVATSLEQAGYSTLLIKDTLVTGGGVEAIKILRTIITGVLLITLFFISYFVIRIILKSRNAYFGILRILGATKRQAKQLLIIELVTVANIAYFSFILLLYLQAKSRINISFLQTILLYLNFSDYALLYITIIIMSYLISVRFSKKIFKNSSMSTMREVV